MNQPRIQPLEAPYSDELQTTFQKLMPPGVEPLLLFRTVGHNPRVLRRMQRGGLLDPGSISLRQRELAILRTCARCGAEYEWGVHATFFGGAAGFDDDALRATVHESADWSGWARDEQLIVALCDALHDRADVDDALWSELEAAFDEAQRIELLMLAGLYHAVSFVVKGTRVELEAAARRFPE